ncbi:MAG: HAD family hydrolase [Alphaproteobacteria bacterium]|nr:HAD family hydrolase [Alphaproteobacteria bacterium]
MGPSEPTAADVAAARQQLGERPIAFDIDGTLVRLEPGEVAAFGRAFSSVFGVVPVLRSWEELPVVTDRGIVITLCAQTLGRVPTVAELDAVADAHVGGVEEMLAHDPAAFSAIRGARRALVALAARGPVGLATGNSRVTARRKLAAAGLDDLDLPLACSQDGEDRESILRHCAGQLGVPVGALISVGDGTWDVTAARALSLPFLGVAPTVRRAERLRAAGALSLVEDLASPWSALAAAQVPAPAPAG